VLDHLVLELLDKETLDKAAVDRIFTNLHLQEVRPAWTGSARRAPSDRPPRLDPSRGRRAKRWINFEQWSWTRVER
jgi:cell division protease FtsH